MITNVVEFRDQISCVLPGQAKKAMKKTENEDKMVEILIETLISNKHLAEGFYNVFISMDKNQAANIVYQAMKHAQLLEDNHSIQESKQALSGRIRVGFLLIMFNHGKIKG